MHTCDKNLHSNENYKYARAKAAHVTYLKEMANLWSQGLHNDML